MKNQTLSLVFLLSSFSFSQVEDSILTPEQIVVSLIEAMEVNDEKQIKNAFAKNATQEYKRWWARKKTGKKFWSWLQSDIIDVKGKVNNPNFKVTKNQIVVTGTYSNNNNYRSPADFLFVVENGKIISWTLRYD